MRTALDTVPAASVPFAGELVKLLKAHLGEPGGREPACERCQGTGTTSTGYHCGCASSRTWQRRGGGAVWSTAPLSASPLNPTTSGGTAPHPQPPPPTQSNP